MANENEQAQGAQAAGLQIAGGAAIVAPVSAFKNGIPPNALIVLPVQKPTDELKAKLEEGPVAVTQQQMWDLLGFNGPAVQVQDDQGRPLVIGLEDLLAGLEKHFTEKPDDLNRGRIFAQELMKYERFQRAEQVLSKVVAKGGTLKGAQNLLKTNPYPSLHLSKLFKQKGDMEQARSYADKAIELDGDSLDAWAYLFTLHKDADGEEAAVAAMEKLAADKKTSRPYVAMQAYFGNNAETRDKAIEYGQKALAQNPDDVLGLLSLSALYGQKGDLEGVVKLLQPHEAKMTRDVRIANNYFEALFQSRQIDKVTKLLNALAGSQTAQVKQFAIERSKMVAQFLQQQQQQLAAMQKRN
jgi:tetratricopeptide (TPR) repeat protein